MKVNSECAKKVLLKIEELPFGEVITVNKLQEMISEYNIEEIITMVTMLNRERYITIFDKAGYDDTDVFRDNRIKCLTEKGYRALDIIRDDKIWNLMKEKLFNFNDLSFFTIITIASKIINDEHNKLFNLDSNSFIDYSRW